MPTPNISWTLPSGDEIFPGVRELQEEEEGNVYADSSISESSPYRRVSTLYIGSATPDYEGTYICNAVNNVENLVGATDGASAELTVQGKPVLHKTRTYGHLLQGFTS